MRTGVCPALRWKSTEGREALSRLLLQADVTANDADDKALLKRFGLFGPPGIIFFDAQGHEIREARVIGYQKPERFLESLQQILPAAALASPQSSDAK